jgi:hypothetical protein
LKRLLCPMEDPADVAIDNDIGGRRRMSWNRGITVPARAFPPAGLPAKRDTSGQAPNPLSSSGAGRDVPFGTRYPTTRWGHDRHFGTAGSRATKHRPSRRRAPHLTQWFRTVRKIRGRENRVSTAELSATNAAVLLAAYRASAAEVGRGRSIVPAAEWLLDNYHVVEAQIREVREDLPPGYYRQLPKLADGPFAGYPQVFSIAWAFVAHTDSHFDPETLRRYIVAYQSVQPLTIGELWALPITLRIVLIENLRRLADQITKSHAARSAADALADVQLADEAPAAAMPPGLPGRDEILSDAFAAQLAKRLRGRDPRTTPALGWLEARLEAQGSSIETSIQRAQERQGASNVTVRNTSPGCASSRTSIGRTSSRTSASSTPVFERKEP